ncbi:MAG: hypothetical protein KA764_03545 [Anaerolineales bacterium]|nr:hypothetical protein [Anaerolineales bacterium]
MTTKPASPPRPASGAPGVNGLITAVAVAATLGGWAILSLTPTEAAGADTPDASAAPAQSALVQPAAPQLRRVASPPVTVTRSSR